MLPLVMLPEAFSCGRQIFLRKYPFHGVNLANYYVIGCYPVALKIPVPGTD
jgi:hypothetical protein